MHVTLSMTTLLILQLHLLYAESILHYVMHCKDEIPVKLGEAYLLNKLLTLKL